MNKKTKLALLAAFSATSLIACGPTSVKNQIAQTETVVKSNIEKNNIPIEIDKLEPTELPGFYRLNIKNQEPVYVSKDGNYVIAGGIINIGEMPAEEISEKVQRLKAKQALKQIAPEELIVYPATQEKYSITVFTDASCDFCKALHSHVPELNKQGITVKYAAFPRGNEFKPLMESVWCSKDRKTALEQAMQGKKVTSAACQSPVEKHVAIGHTLKISGTPAIFSELGRPLFSSLHPTMLLKELETLDAHYHPQKNADQKPAKTEK